MRKTTKDKVQAISPGALLKRVLREIQKEPLKHLPERSVEALSQYLSGYVAFGGPTYYALDYFGRWLTTEFDMPPGIGTWVRWIQLNSADAYNGYEMFFRLYFRFNRDVREIPDILDIGSEFDSTSFDFYQWLFAISSRPGMYFGLDPSITSLAACLSGYFAGKKASGIQLSADEKEFLGFDKWLCRRHGLKKPYPWHRVIGLWPYGDRTSVENFFAHFDAYLTSYRKKPRGLEDLFEIVKDEHSTRCERRGKRPRKVIPGPETKRWWLQK